MGLIRSKWLNVLPVVIAVSCRGPSFAGEDAKGKVRLLPSEANSTRVSCTLEVGGDLVSEGAKDTTRHKLSVVAELEYEELRLAGSREENGIVRAVRSYKTAKSTVKIGDGGTNTELRPGRRLIGVELDGTRTTVFSPAGTMTRGELDLIDNVANSLGVEGLLPAEAVGEGDTWSLSKEFAAGFLSLDAVSECAVECAVTEVTPEVVRFQFTGDVEGAKHGVVTRLGVKGKARFDRRLNAVDWVGLLIKEVRPMGHVTHGLDVVVRVQSRMVPVEKSTALNEETLAEPVPAPTPELTALFFEPVHEEWTLEHDRGWHANLNHHDLAVFRLLDHGKFIAQCNVSPLPKVEPGKQATLEDFQREIESLLDETSRGFADAGQWSSDKEYRILRTTVLGEVEGQPITWRYYLVSDRHGRRATFAFSVATDLVERLADMDRRLVESLTFAAPKVAAVENKGKREERK